jgi:hypothetical protein
MREFVYFVVSLAGTALFAALAVIYPPSSVLWKIILYLSLLTFFIAAIAFAAIFIDRRLRRSKKVNYAHWDPLNDFAIWHIAFLWNDIEPEKDSLDKSPTYARFRRLKQDLDQKVFKGPVQNPLTGWRDELASRQQIADYAISIGERPGFVFPYMRRWSTRLRYRLTRNEVPKDQVNDFRDFSLMVYGLHHTGHPIEKIYDYLRPLLLQGKARMIGRRNEGGILGPHEHISPGKWWRLELNTYEISGDGYSYRDLKLKVPPAQ